MKICRKRPKELWERQEKLKERKYRENSENKKTRKTIKFKNQRKKLLIWKIVGNVVKFNFKKFLRKIVQLRKYYEKQLKLRKL